MKHELDCTVVDRAFKNRGRFNVHITYVVDDLGQGIEGTDLFPEDCDEDVIDDRVDLQQGFSPTQPRMMATGDYFDENPEDDRDSYYEIEPCEVCWINAYGQECDEDESDPSDTESNYSDCYTD